MSDAFFAGAYGGDASSLPDRAKLECKICWHVYDPAAGDSVWQILPGTAFADLPSYWSCPQCGAAKQDFLLLDA
ncbi:MAG: rubredoxin [Methylomonas sp.]|jgi:rubredoxin|uniref:rubredoxin n=1 Tax=Methylomonas sp. TaxID=418 RepID=UPI0025F16180|nr:rubredoxin [Methylomonas sp.]MCK9607441.1 rubredoxin [Methylomonas sp.]